MKCCSKEKMTDFLYVANAILCLAYVGLVFYRFALRCKASRDWED